MLLTRSRTRYKNFVCKPTIIPPSSGRAAGGIYDVVTKSGTNDLHFTMGGSFIEIAL